MGELSASPSSSSFLLTDEDKMAMRQGAFTAGGRLQGVWLSDPLPAPDYPLGLIHERKLKPWLTLAMVILGFLSHRSAGAQ